MKKTINVRVEVQATQKVMDLTVPEGSTVGFVLTKLNLPLNSECRCEGIPVGKDFVCDDLDTIEVIASLKELINGLEKSIKEFKDLFGIE